MAAPSKSPAFQFYAADFLADERVSLMSLEEVGAYIIALAYCWREGSIPADDTQLSRLCKGANTTVIRVVKGCFNQSVSDPLRLVNTRLELEREKQRVWSEKSSTGGKKAAEKRWGSKRGKVRVVKPKRNHPGKGGIALQSSSSSSNNIIIPESLLSQPGFETAWSGYLESRAKKGKTYIATEKAQELILKTLTQHPSRAVAGLEKAIERRWTGFEWDWLENSGSQKGGTHGQKSNSRGIGGTYDPTGDIAKQY